MSTPASPLTARQLYGRLLSYAKPYWPQFLATVLAMAVFAATETGMAALMKPLIDSSFVERNLDQVKLIAYAIPVIFVIRGFASFFTTYGLGWIARNVIFSLRKEMFTRLLTLPASFFDKSTSGQLMSKLLFDVEQVSSAATDAILTIIRDSLTIIGLLAWMLYLNSTLTMIIFVTVPFIAIPVYFISHRFRRISKNIQNSMGDVGHISTEIIDGHREIKTFGSQAYEQERFLKINNRNRQQVMKRIATDAVSQPLIQLITVLGLSMVILYASKPGIMADITAGNFISFITAMFMILTPLKRLTKVNVKIQAGIAAAESIFGLLDQAPEKDTGKQTLGRAEGQIDYQSVSFRYENSERDILNNVAFTAAPGQTIAFVGQSGSGKTTLVSLLTRFYEHTQGQILIDGIDINNLTLSSLRQQISLVNQQVVLFNDTIANNIAYGQGERISESQIIEAAKSAHAWEFIQRLPEGLNTVVGENGVLLSGGQRQRLAIARALLRDAPILILDEATSALDTEAERHIQAALDNLMQHRTTLVIAHRLSTIENADKIIVMHEGHIVEAGTHEELIALGHHYAELHRLQFQPADA
jgi:subfamily B ATP-binding cassette protein MsbA